MGGPNSLNEVGLFLKNMFNDKAIINVPQPIRWVISYLITKKRLPIAKENYAYLGGKSPIVNYTQQLVSKLNNDMSEDIFYIMRYTPPFADDIIKTIINYDKIYAIPMYPHYSLTTTSSSLQHLFKSCHKYGLNKNKILTIDSYYDNIVYNTTIIKRVLEALGSDNAQEFDLIFSAHGLPQKIIDKGDPYQEHIEKNYNILKKLLLDSDIRFNKVHLSYQSRLGPMKWIEPYLEDTLKNIQNKKVIIYPISFTIDNSETEFELDVEYKEIAKKLGYTDYRVAKVANILMSEVIKDLYYTMCKTKLGK